MTVPDVRLHPGDAAELAELLQFLGDWLGTDRDHLDASLTRFVGNRGYDLRQGPAIHGHEPLRLPARRRRR